MNSRRRVPQMEDVKVTRMINGPEGFTPDNEFCLGETEVPGLFVAGGFCAHGLAGAGGVGKVMAEWIVGGEPSMDLWQMDVRRFGAQYRSPSYTLEAGARDLRDLLRHPLPVRGAPGRAAAAHLAGVRVAPRSRRGVRREVRLGARQLVRVERGARRRVAAPARLGRQALVTRDRRRALACREAAAIFDESSFAKLEVAGPGAAELLERLCDNEVAREVGPRDLHADAELARRDRVRLHGRATRRGALLDRHRHGVRQPRPRMDPPPSPRRRLGPGARRDIALGLLRDLGPALPRDAGPAHAAVARERGLPVHDARARSPWRRAGARAARDVRGRARLGAVLPDRVRDGAVAALWEAGEPHGLVAGGYRAIDSLRVEKGYRVWGADITPDETPYEAGLELRRQARQGLHRPRRARGRREPRKRLACIVLEDARSVALGNEPVRVRGEILGRVTTRRLRLFDRALGCVRVPAARARRARHGGRARDLRAVGRRRGGKEPLFDPSGERVRGSG